jgi:hypothetical protein
MHKDQAALPGRIQQAAAPEVDPFTEQARQLLQSRLPAEDYQPLSARRRGLLAVAGVSMTVMLVWAMTERPGKQDIDPRLQQPDSQRCAPGQTQDCVGGQTLVIVPTMPVFAVPTLSASEPSR